MKLRPRAHHAPDTIHVAIVSGVRLYREGLHRLLAECAGIRIAGAFASVDALLDGLACGRPGAVVLDARMARQKALIGRLRRELAGARLVAVAVENHDVAIVRCVSAGVDHLVSCDAPVESVAEVLRDPGPPSCPPELAHALFRHVSGGLNRPRPAVRLTRREFEIGALIDEGLSNKQIAVRLNVHVATVKNHVHSLLTKLGVSRRGAAAARLRRHALPGRARPGSDWIF